MSTTGRAEAARRVSGDHADFRVRGKVFAYFLNNHHGDRIVSVCCKTALGETSIGRRASRGDFICHRTSVLEVGSGCGWTSTRSPAGES